MSLIYETASEPLHISENPTPKYQGVYSVPVHCSPELADMIRRFLEVSPLKRATIAQAWQVRTPLLLHYSQA